MSNVTENTTWNRKELNTFTRTDITIIVLLLHSSPGWRGLQHNDLGEVEVDASVVRRRGRAMGPSFLAPARSTIPHRWGPPDPLFGVSN